MVYKSKVIRKLEPGMRKKTPNLLERLYPTAKHLICEPRDYRKTWTFISR